MKESYTMLALTFTTILVLVSTVISLLLKEKPEWLKKILFALMVVPIVITTIFLTGSTVYLNLISTSSGPIHWHADFEVWVCGRQVDLVNPHGFSNRVGTSVFHEHADNRVHVEGVVQDLEHVSLGEFFNVVGGHLTKTSLSMPTMTGMFEIENGKYCASGEGQLQVFVYKSEGDKYYQQKLADPNMYVLSPESSVPPGDCIILEFDKLKDKTEKLCQQYKLKEQLGEINYGN